MGSDARSHAFTLDAYGKYLAEVRAVNDIGESDYIGAQVSVASPPAAIASIAVTRSDKKLKLSWTVPANGGLPIIEYEAECKDASAQLAEWGSCSDAITPDGEEEGETFKVTISGVNNDTPYYVRVRSDNDAAKSAWTESSEIAAASPPGNPSNIAAVRYRGGTMAVSWSAATGATSYDVRLMDGEGANALQTEEGVTSLNHVFGSVDHSIANVVSIRANNDFGSSPWTNSDTIPVPPSDLAQTASITAVRSDSGDQITVTWDAVTGATGYDVNYTDDDGENWVRVASNTEYTTKTSTVKKDKTYIFSVRAVNALYEGEWKNSGKVEP